MAAPSQQRFTIGQMMVAVAIFAIAGALLFNPNATRAASIIIGLIGIGILSIVSVVAAIDFLLGVRCPRCQGWSMARTSVITFRDRFFKCSKCGARCRRSFFQGWGDATGPEYDAYFARKRPENPWTAPPGLEDEDMIYSKTHVNLLLNKKRRNPNAPDQSEGLPR